MIRVLYAWRTLMSRFRLPPPQPEACLTSSRASRFRGGTIIAEDVWSLEEHLRRLADADLYRPATCPRCGGDCLHVHDYPERRPLGIALLVVVRIIRFLCFSPDCGATWRILPAFLARHLWWTWETVETVGVPTAAEESSPTASSERLAKIDETAAAGPETGSAAQSHPRRSEVTSGTSPAAGGAVPTFAPRPTHRGRPRAVPRRTRQRWQARLASSVRQLLVLLASRGTVAVVAVATPLPLDSTRWELLRSYIQALAPPPGTGYGSLAALVDRLERGLRLM